MSRAAIATKCCRLRSSERRAPEEAQIRLVHERRALQRMIRPLSAQLEARDPPQFVVDERQELLERLLIAICPMLQQAGDVMGWLVGHATEYRQPPPAGESRSGPADFHGRNRRNRRPDEAFGPALPHS